MMIRNLNKSTVDQTKLAGRNKSPVEELTMSGDTCLDVGKQAEYLIKTPP